MFDQPTAVATLDDALPMALDMVEALRRGEEHPIWIKARCGDFRLAYTIRRQGGAYRIRDADLSDIGTFATLGPALEHGQAIVESLL